MRNSGIDIIGNVPWGTHFCQFYQTKEDLIDILVPYFKKGLENNEFCMWITSHPLSREEAKNALRIAVPDIDDYLKKGQIEIIPYTDWYIKGGSFNSKRVLNDCVEKLNHALNDGYDGLRLTSNTFWLEKDDWKDFVNYEEEVNHMIGNYQMIAICTYSLDKCNANEIIDMTINHQFTLIKREGKWELIESSERKKAEKSLKKAYENLEDQIKKRTEELKLAIDYNRSLIEASLDPLVTIGPDGKITDVNNSTETVTGYPRDEIIGTDFSNYFTEPEKARKGYQQVFKEGMVRNYHLEIKHKYGHVTPVLYNSSVYKDESGEVIGVFAAARDISELLKAKEKIQRLADVVESSDDAIITKSLDGEILSWNKGAEQVYGYSAEEVIGKNMSILASPQLKEEAKQLIEKIKQGKKIIHYETLRVKKDGKEINVSITLSPVFDNVEKLVNISSVQRDITEGKKAEIELQKYRENLEEQVKVRTEELAKINEMLRVEIREHEKTERKMEKLLEELSRSNKELEQFAYVASHDLQEPLRMITSFLQLLARRYENKLDSDADEFIHFAVDGATRMQELINDLLIYSRVTTMGNEFSDVDLQKVLDEVQVNLKVPIEEADAIISQDPLPVIFADYTQMIQLFQNIIGNAIKYRDKQTPQIHISAEKKDGEWFFSVQDNGIGINPQYSDRIFMIFQRLHGRAAYEGTGIGLAIAKKIVERHGGHIWVKSKPGKGSKFYFTIPLGDERI